jgi:hypothetical protein
MKTLVIMLLTLGSTCLLIGADTKVTLSGVHLCCKGCVKGVSKAVEQSGGKATCDAKAGTDGATKHTAKKGSETFEVKGNFNAKAFIKALHDNGLHAFVK